MTETQGRDIITWSPDEIMSVVGSRALVDGMICFVGIGLPSTVANLARRTHAPGLVMVYESGPIGSKPAHLPLSIGDGELASTADVVVSIPEMFNYWLQGGRIDMGYLTAAQIDRFGNLNSTVIGADYDAPLVRLPGAGGAPEIAASCKEFTIVMRHQRQKFVREVDFVSSVGFGLDGQTRDELGMRGNGPCAVITDLGVLEPDPVDNELTLVSIHPGVDLQDIVENTQWPLRVSPALRETAPPTSGELSALRSLKHG